MLEGNYENKYESRGIFSKHFVGSFLKSLDYLIKVVENEILSINEIGCGEGYLTRHIRRNFQGELRGCDYSKNIIQRARELSRGQDILFYQKSIYKLGGQDRADMLVCCEVLEHLECPEEALSRLAETADRYVILSVPREPVWRMLNMIRMKYTRHLGNTPGHLQHWSRGRFIKFIEDRLEIVSES